MVALQCSLRLHLDSHAFGARPLPHCFLDKSNTDYAGNEECHLVQNAREADTLTRTQQRTGALQRGRAAVLSITASSRRKHRNILG